MTINTGAGMTGRKGMMAFLTRICAAWRLRAALVAVACVGLVNAVGATASKPKPTLTIASSLACYDPNALAVNGLVNDDNRIGIAYESLINPKPGAGVDGPFEPGLAASWKISNADRVITFTLRPNARFSDGTYVTAQAVKTWLTYMEPVLVAQTQFLTPIRSIKVLSKWVVRITFTVPNPAVLYDMSTEEAAGEVESPKAIAYAKAHPKGSMLSDHTFGAGPYVLDASQSVVGDHCTYVPNKYFYDPSAIVWSKIVTKDISDPDTALAGMESGQIDVLERADPTTISAARGAGFRVYATPTNTQFIEFPNLGSETVTPALKNVKVRQALNYAINRTVIFHAFFPAGKHSSSIDFLSGGDSTKYVNYYSYDPAKAKALLAAAGYPNGFTIKMLAYGPDPTYHIDGVGEAVCRYWNAIGVKCSVDVLQGNQYNTAQASNDYGAISSVSGSSPVYTWYLGSLGPKQTGGFDIHDPIIDALATQGARLSPGSAAATKVWQRLMDRVITQAYFVGLGAPGGTTYFNSKVVTGVKVGYNLSSSILAWVPAK
jgi:peptide/nickel transport system substrate-binding protein